MLRCPGTHHGVARVSYAQANWDGLRGEWKKSEGRGLRWVAQVGGRGLGCKRNRFFGPGASCSGLTGLDRFVRAECDTTCLWIYICEYAASLLEADVFVVTREFMQGYK